jgi:hypothetical protein
MNRKFLLIVCCLISAGSIAQSNLSIAKEISKNFNYDTLPSISCLNVPVGIYLVSFQIDKNRAIKNFVFSNDSLTDLNFLFFEAIQKSIFSGQAKLKQGKYLQLIYFSNVSFCNENRDKNNKLKIIGTDTATIDFSINDKDIIQQMNLLFASFEKSIINLSKKSFSGTFTYLPVAIINNVNPNRKISSGFKNDVQIHKVN